MNNARTTINIKSKTELFREKDVAVYVMRSEKLMHFERLEPKETTSIIRYQQRIIISNHALIKKTPIMGLKTLRSQSVAWQRPCTFSRLGQGNDFFAWLETPIPPTVFTRPGVLWLLPLRNKIWLNNISIHSKMYENRSIYAKQWNLKISFELLSTNCPQGG